MQIKMQKAKTLLLISILFASCFLFLSNTPFVFAVATWTYNAGTNTATAAGAGSTDFTALVAADTAGGWGVYTADASGTQISIGGKIIVGDGTNATVLSDTNKEVILLNGTRTANSQAVILCMNNSQIILGTATDSTNKIVKDGCSITDLNTVYYGWIIKPNTDSSSCVIYLYASTFNAVVQSGEGGVEALRIWNCKFLGYSHHWKLTYTNTAVDINNILGSTEFTVIRNPTSITTINSITATVNTNFLLYCGNVGSITVRNIKATLASGTYIARLYSIGTTQIDLINVDSNLWRFSWNDASTGVIYRKYEYDLTVLNGEITDFVENANVTLSKSGTQIGSWLTNSSGQIDTQTVTYGFYNQTGGNTLYNGSDPFVLTVTHPDWADYTSRFYVTEKTKMTISMQDTTTANNAALIWSLLFGALAFALFLAWRVRR